MVQTESDFNADNPVSGITNSTQPYEGQVSVIGQQSDKVTGSKSDKITF